MEKLKPCPFCGGEAKLVQEQNKNHAVYVICKKCGCMTKAYTRFLQALKKCDCVKYAVEDWNRRTEN